MKKVITRKDGGTIVVGRDPRDIRIEQLAKKPNRTQAETIEEIRHRLERLEELFITRLREGGSVS